MKYDFTLNEDQRRLVEKSLPLVRWTIRRYISSNESVTGLGLDDLYQEGCTALCRAAASYQPERGEFSTLAVTAIRNHLTEYCRKIAADTRNLPTLSLEAMAEEGREIEANGMGPPAAEDEALVRISIAQVLKSRKDRYTGSAKLGIEALELKVLEGRGVTEIARLYDSKPNEVGAWIARAAKKLREDATDGELYALGARSA